MAHIGMKYPVAAPWEEGETYGKGFVIGRAINFTGTPNRNDATLYADDAEAESDKTVRDFGTSLNVDDLALEVIGKLLGHPYKKVEGEDGELETLDVGADDVAPYFGVGFYKRRKKNGVETFTAIWLRKVKHTEPTENAETKGESVNFQTPTIEGTAYPVEITGDGSELRMSVMKKATFRSESRAREWLNKLANITTPEA